MASSVPSTSYRVLTTAHTLSAVEPGPSKRRKLERACDACRRRKTRCDGPQQHDGICSSCRQASRHCTYVEASKPRGPPKAYINTLEDRVDRLESLLKRLRPEIDLNAELGPPIVRDSWKSDTQSHPPPPPPPPRDVPLSFVPNARRLSDSAPSASFLPRLRKASSFPVFSASAPDPDVILSNEDTSGEEDPYEAELKRTIDAMDKRLRLTELEPAEKGNRLLDRQFRYHGSSAPILLATAVQEHRLTHLKESVNSESSSPLDTAETTRALFIWESLHREEFWQAPAWELDYEGVHITAPTAFPSLQLHWPTSDLATALINLYFYHFNSMFPLLHRPTFERRFSDRLYERDIWFACVCMGVFAIASRHSSDPRVLYPMPTDTKITPQVDAPDTSWHSAGVKYYFAVMSVLKRKQSMLTPSSLFEVQSVCLATHFQRSTRWAAGAWIAYATAIRQVQDVGAHRKRSYQLGFSVENELWKRAYWYLVGFDRTGSVSMGHPCSTRYEDTDAELPLSVDDEYWETDDPAQAFRQPNDKPVASVTAFILWLRLTEISSLVLFHFYVVNPSRRRFAANTDNVLKQINASMTEWIETVPEQLRWSSNIPDPIAANQSATLFLNYNLLTILIQRAFLPQSVVLLNGLAHPHTQDISGYPQAATAFAISVNAARAGTRILEVAHKRNLSNMPLFLLSADVFAAMLCLDIWIIGAREKSRRLAGSEADLGVMQTIETLLGDLNVLLALVESAVPRWETASSILAYIKAMMPTREDKTEWNNPHLEVLPAEDTVASHAGLAIIPVANEEQNQYFIDSSGNPSAKANQVISHPSFSQSNAHVHGATSSQMPGFIHHRVQVSDNYPSNLEHSAQYRPHRITSYSQPGTSLPSLSRFQNTIVPPVRTRPGTANLEEHELTYPQLLSSSRSTWESEIRIAGSRSSLEGHTQIPVSRSRYSTATPSQGPTNDLPEPTNERTAAPRRL